jgi:hypothetical protein
MVVFALLFGAAGIVQDGSGAYDWAAGVLMVGYSLLILAIGISLSTAQAEVTRSQIQCRYGIVRRLIPSEEVESVVVGPGSGAYYRRICLHVRQRGRSKPVRLLALQRPDTAKGRAELQQTAAEVLFTIGRFAQSGRLGSPSEPLHPPLDTDADSPPTTAAPWTSLEPPS